MTTGMLLSAGHRGRTYLFKCPDKAQGFATRFGGTSSPDGEGNYLVTF